MGSQITDNAPLAPHQTGLYGWYVIFVLTLCQALSFLDAKLPFIMVEAIKKDLKLSDTQLGLITGPAFSLTYAICAIPIAKLSDKYMRTRVISLAVLVWSGLTAAGAAAISGTTFALSRVGVAAGEAALSPAAHSMISDCTTPTTRPRAMAVFGLGAAVGTGIALGLGGLGSDRWGWRITLALVGGVGILLMLLVTLTVREPVRRIDAASNRSLPKGNLKSLLGDPAIRNIVIGGSLMGLSTGAVNAWAPAYIMRSFGKTATETGVSYGTLQGVVGISGLLLGGLAASWLAKRKAGHAFRMLAAAFAVAALLQFASFLVGDFVLFLALNAATMLLVALYFAPTYATVQSLSHPSARSFAAAVTLFAVNGLGVASGSFLTGLFSDLLHPAFGADSLRYSLIMLTFMTPWAALHYYLAACAIDRALAG